MSPSSNFMESKLHLNFEDPSIFHDCVLIVGEKKFHVVSGTLSMWSEFFRGLFSENFDEADKKEIDLEEVDADILEIFLRSVYLHSLSVINVADIIPLIELSYRFLTPVVLEQCEKYIDKNLKKLDDVKLELLETVCDYGIQGLKIKLTDNLKDPNVLSKFSCIKIIEIAEEHKLEEIKNNTVLFMKGHLTFENCSEFLDCCNKFDLPDVKITVTEMISKWKFEKIPSNLVIQLTKCAFKHDMKNLKNHIRHRIHFMADKYSNETFEISKKNNAKEISVFTFNWFLKANEKEIFELPAEISKFIIMSTCKYNLQ